MSCLDVCRHPNVRIEAHKVYNEFIQDKHHIHMNSTKWITLTEYVKYLGREGLCKVEDSPKGWFMQLIHRDPEQVCLLSMYRATSHPTNRYNPVEGRPNESIQMLLKFMQATQNALAASMLVLPCFLGYVHL
jgi:hypothetical protein